MALYSCCSRRRQSLDMAENSRGMCKCRRLSLCLSQLYSKKDMAQIGRLPLYLGLALCVGFLFIQIGLVMRNPPPSTPPRNHRLDVQIQDLVDKRQAQERDLDALLKQSRVSAKQALLERRRVRMQERPSGMGYVPHKGTSTLVEPKDKSPEVESTRASKPVHSSSTKSFPVVLLAHDRSDQLQETLHSLLDGVRGVTKEHVLVAVDGQDEGVLGVIKEMGEW